MASYFCAVYCSNCVHNLREASDIPAPVPWSKSGKSEVMDCGFRLGLPSVGLLGSCTTSGHSIEVQTHAGHSIAFNVLHFVTL